MMRNRVCLVDAKQAAIETDSARSARAGAMRRSLPPTSNTGEPAGSGEVAKAEPISRSFSHLVVISGKVVEVPLKVGVGTAAVIDTLTLTMSEDVFIRPDQLGTEEEIACNISAELQGIFGFGLGERMKGRNGYAHSWKMGCGDDVNYGFAALGGKQQRGSICLYFTGQGLIAALDGWEHRLYEFLQERAPTARITRCDLAHDFFHGEYTPDMALSDWEAGGFTSSHTVPIGECYGSDWLRNEGRGKTFYVGSRKNSPRFVRVYEKGKEQGDSESAWVRVELEMHNRRMVIPHDVLIEPGRYLTGAYPVFQGLFSQFDEAPAKPEIVKRLGEVGVEHCVKYASMQASPTIKLLSHLGLDENQIIDVLLNPASGFPKRVNPKHYDCQQGASVYLHQLSRPVLSEDAVLDRLGNELASPPRYPVQPTPDQAYLRRLRQTMPNQAERERGVRKPYDPYGYYLTPHALLNPDFRRNRSNESNASSCHVE